VDHYCCCRSNKNAFTPNFWLFGIEASSSIWKSSMLLTLMCSVTAEKMGLHAAAEVAPHSGEFTTRVAALKERTSILKSFVAQGTQLIARLQHSRPEALNARQGKKLVAFVSEGQDALNSLPLLESGKIQEPGRIAALETTFEKLSEVRDTTLQHSLAATAAEFRCYSAFILCNCICCTPFVSHVRNNCCMLCWWLRRQGRLC
jgi:hypothetical protein